MAELYYKTTAFTDTQSALFSAFTETGGDTHGEWVRYKILPFARHYISVRISGDAVVDSGTDQYEFPKCTISGCMLKPYWVEVKGNWNMLIIGLKPTVFYSRFGIDMRKLGPIHLPIEGFIPGIVPEELLRIIRKNQTFDDRIWNVQKYLEALVQPARPCMDIGGMTRAFSSDPDIGIDKILDQLDMNRPKFDREFNKVMGVPAGKYFNLIRVFNVLHQLRNEPSSTIESLARDFGYTDHSHLIKDVKKHLKITPTEFKNLKEPLIQESLKHAPKDYHVRY